MAPEILMALNVHTLPMDSALATLSQASQLAGSALAARFNYQWRPDIVMSQGQLF